MRRPQLPILLLAMLVVSGCDNDDVARVIDPPAPTIEEQIIADCHVVRDALEAFAAENNGDYPCCFDEQSDAGRPFITYLPAGALLTNRYTGLATTPGFNDAQWPGQIGVIKYYDDTTTASGYRVVGRGRYGELIRIDNLAMISQQTLAAYDSVFANCDVLVNAVEEFAAQNGGVYASSTGGDALPSGDVLVDLLPGGNLLLNPYSGYRDSPVDGSPSYQCQVGYSPEDWNGDGVWDEYRIEAIGGWSTTIVKRTRDSDENGATRRIALYLQTVAEEFASLNGGEYPHDIDVDETPTGDTLLELASCPGCDNPYTGASAFRNGLATSRGEVGYVPLEYNGIVVGYVINALGLFNEELERFEVLTN